MWFNINRVKTINKIEATKINIIEDKNYSFSHGREFYPTIKFHHTTAIYYYVCIKHAWRGGVYSMFTCIELNGMRFYFSHFSSTNLETLINTCLHCLPEFFCPLPKDFIQGKTTKWFNVCLRDLVKACWSTEKRTHK